MFCYVMKDACGSGKSRVAAVFLRQGGEALASNQSLYLTSVTREAAPKCISGSTSYLQV